MAIKSFKDSATEHIACRNNSKEARKALPQLLHNKAWIKLTKLNAAPSLAALASLGGSRLEKLHGNRAGQYSIRINDKYRICFNWKGNNAEEVEIVDYH